MLNKEIIDIFVVTLWRIRLPLSAEIESTSAISATCIQLLSTLPTYEPSLHSFRFRTRKLSGLQLRLSRLYRGRR
jgi:hypothetical protein